MKTTLALLIAGLIFLATPMLASADGRHHDNGQNHDQREVKHNRYNDGGHYKRYDQKRDHQNANRHGYRAKRHPRRELRVTRHELRQAKRHIRYSHRRPYYTRPFYPNPAIIIGLPHLLFLFD